MPHLSLTRRRFLQATIAANLGLPLLRANAQTPRDELPVAGVVTTYTRNTHADVILGKILDGWRQDGGPGPRLKLVSLYVDQVGKSDLSRDLAARHGFHLADTIADAVTMGKKALPVSGVISIGEHGNYPVAEDTGQKKYPRRRFFDEIVSAMRQCGSVVPVFSDKHLAYRWEDAKHMFDTAKQLQIPFMAGSSLPVAWRYPRSVLPMGSEIQEALSLGYGGHESYGFHALEALQSMVERRRGGETGVHAVTTLRGQAIIEAEQRGLWSKDLLVAAAKSANRNVGDWKKHVNDSSALFHIEYRDGLRASVAMLRGFGETFAVACRIKEQPQPYACWNRLEMNRPYGHFAYLVRAIESMIRTGVPAYPVERTLLTTGILARAMESRSQQSQRMDSPELKIAYQPTDWPFANQHEENFPG